MKIRGTWFEHRGIPVMPTYHPAFVLRAYTEENRRKVWSDLQAVMTKIGRGK
jgi:DNA polymerase